jgi:hypothetical protein
LRSVSTQQCHLEKGVLMCSRRFRARIVIFFVALACVVDATSAHAHTDFDGDWSIVIATLSGPCDGTLRYDVKVADGTVINDGVSIAIVQGRVTPRGTVLVLVRSGDQSATGSGHLGRNHGSGVWRGRGTGGACAGTWAVERRE